MRNVLAAFNEYVHLNRRIPDEVLLHGEQHRRPVTPRAHGRGAPAGQGAGQAAAARDRTGRRAAQALLGAMLASELEIVKLERKIEGQVRSQVHKNQKEFYLNEQLKAIRKELGYQNEFASEIEEVAQAIRKSARMPQARSHAKRDEGARPPGARCRSCRPRRRWCATTSTGWSALPWSKRDQGPRRPGAGAAHPRRGPLRPARRSRSASSSTWPVLKLTGENKGPILCFVGPPGRGQDVARQVDRPRAGPQVRARRRWAACATRPRSAATGAPTSARCRAASCRACKQAGTQNPVFLLDEIDKLGARLPRRSRVGAARGARSRAEPLVQRPLPRGRVRPVAGHVHLHGEHALHDPAGAGRPHGDHPPAGLPRDEKVADRASTSCCPRQRKAAGLGRDGHPDRRPRRSAPSCAATRARPACATSSARSRRSAARWRKRKAAGTLEKARARHGREPARVPGPGQLPRGRRSSARSGSAWRPAWRGPRPAATSCTIEVSRSCPARATCC